eukprot:SAG31_NODE_8898_length_1366_cov_1.806630_1_plen_306_part_10
MVVIPHDCSAPDGPVLLLDGGSCEVRGTHNEPKIAEVVHTESPHSFFSEHVEMRVRQLQVFLLDSGSTDLLSVLQSSTGKFDRRLLRRFDLTCNIDSDSVQTHPQGPNRIAVSVTTSDIWFASSPTQIKQLILFSSRLKTISYHRRPASHLQSPTESASQCCGSTVLFSNSLFIDCPALRWCAVADDIKCNEILVQLINVVVDCSHTDKELAFDCALHSMQVQDVSREANLMHMKREEERVDDDCLTKLKVNYDCRQVNVHFAVGTAINIDWHPSTVATVHRYAAAISSAATIIAGDPGEKRIHKG